MRKIPQLDSIRGIAVLMVILLHASDKYPQLHLQRIFENGWMGVDAFFVLSGFLITGVLVESKQFPNFFRNFYARRCLRIWPLYYAVLLFMFVAVPLALPSQRPVIFAPRSSPWWAYPLFLQNLLVPIPTMATGSLGVMWSLAIEEQFYLVWPFLVRYVRAERLRLFALAIVCLSPVLRFFFARHGGNIYSNPLCRLDGLMAGAYLAFTARRTAFTPERFLPLARVCFPIASALAFTAEYENALWITLSCTALASFTFLYLALYEREGALQRILRNRFLMYTGSISYGLYLLHKIPFDTAQATHLDRYPALAFFGGICACYALAALSFRFVEQPFLRYKRRFYSLRDHVATERKATASASF
jgi:peptidoglycan/LPS O-acetylase OafA/YrhL